MRPNRKGVTSGSIVVVVKHRRDFTVPLPAVVKRRFTRVKIEEVRTVKDMSMEMLDVLISIALGTSM